MRRIILVVAICVGLAAPPVGQQRADFSGSWIASKETPSDVPAAPSAVLGARLWLQQTGDRLTIVRPVREMTVATTFPMDGTEVRSRIPGGACQGDAEVIETVGWEGDAIAFTVVGSIPRGGGAASKFNIKRLLRLHSSGALVIAATMRDPPQGQPRQAATVYKRSQDPAPTVDPVAPTTQATLAQVEWIAGVWIGTTGNITVEERWTPAAGGSMLATARTLRAGALASFEFLCISARNGGLVYTALPNARTPATDFTLTGVTADSVTFENLKHDFPKLIRYTRRQDGALETTVAGDPKQATETFVLKRSRD